MCSQCGFGLRNQAALGSNPSFTSSELCGVGHIASPLCALVSKAEVRFLFCFGEDSRRQFYEMPRPWTDTEETCNKSSYYYRHSSVKKVTWLREGRVLWKGFWLQSWVVLDVNLGKTKPRWHRFLEAPRHCISMILCFYRTRGANCPLLSAPGGVCVEVPTSTRFRLASSRTLVHRRACLVLPSWVTSLQRQPQQNQW